MLGAFIGDTTGTGAEDSSLTGTLTFTDAADGDTAPNYTVTAAASNGTASIDASTGAWTYAPTQHFNGSDSFTVTVTDDDGHEETHVITLTVDPANDVGAFSGDNSGTGDEDAGSITGTLTFTDAIDGDTALTFTVSSDASNGTASIDASTGAWTYAPNEHFNGLDSFTVTVTDDDGHEETQVITLTLSPLNDAGSFSGDTTGTGAEDSSLTGTLTFTDAADGDSAPNYTVTAAASNGTASIDASTGAWTYAPTQHFNGSDSFTVTVTDDDGHEETHVITLTVDPVNDRPVLADASLLLNGISEDPGVPSGAVGTLVSSLIDNSGVLSNYSDEEGDSPGIAITGVNLGGGTLYYSTDGGTSWSDVGPVSENSARVLYADGDTRLAFTPAADFHGSISDVVTLKAWDRTGGYTNGKAGVPTKPSVSGYSFDTPG